MLREWNIFWILLRRLFYLQILLEEGQQSPELCPRLPQPADHPHSFARSFPLRSWSVSVSAFFFVKSSSLNSFLICNHFYSFPLSAWQKAGGQGALYKGVLWILLSIILSVHVTQKGLIYWSPRSKQNVLFKTNMCPSVSVKHCWIQYLHIPF